MLAALLLLAPSLGTTHFPISCNKTAQADVTRGMLALHSFWYEEAQPTFERAEKDDPRCAMAYVGEALSRDFLLWGFHDQEAGAKALAKVPADARMTPREKLLLEAARALFAEGDDRVPKLRGFEAVLARAHTQFPTDDELESLYALAILSRAGAEHPDEKYIGDRARAAALAMEVFARNPNHPGAAHYIIHALDLPELAPMALPAARKYASIAPEAPHARHMPAHIYSRLGMWPDALASCESAWGASDKWARKKGWDLGKRDYHSMHWIVELRLQMGQRKAADEALANWTQTAATTTEPSMKAHYLGLLGSYLRATGSWDRLESLLAPVEKQSAQQATAAGPGCGPHAAHAGMPWDSVIAMNVSTLRALAAATRGDAKTARAQWERSKKVGRPALAHEEQMEGKKLVEMETRQADLEFDATLAIGRKDDKAAIPALRKRMDLESRFGGSEGSPPYVTADSLGEALLRTRQARPAAEVFEQTLSEYPGHARALLGLARARKALGDDAGAKEAYAQLLMVWKDADTDTPGLAEAKAAAGLAAR